MTATLGLDIGGANLKAAHTDGTARTRAFALWKAPDQLAAQLAALRAEMPPHDRLAVTMTGELCDCFPTKQDGVLAILRSVEAMAGRTPVAVWTTRPGFVDLPTARDNPLSVAAANWLALAHLCGRLIPAETSLLIDTGSTTTDIVYLGHGVPEPRGLTDQERMRCGELAYTGVRRTPVCAVLGMEVAAEFFATMLDAYLLLGLSPENPRDTDTADGCPATVPYARARLARLLCADVDEVPADRLQQLARRAVDRQTAQVSRAVDQVLCDRPTPQTVILSGSGEVLGRLVCERDPRLAGRRVSLAERLGPGRSAAACAYAVATLATDPEAADE